MRLVLITLFAAVLVCPTPAQQSQPSQSPAPDTVFRSRANVVSVNVSVLDGTGRRFVTDLSQAARHLTRAPSLTN